MKLQATPNLFRAVAECTQPYGPPVSGSSIRLLQSYLANERCVDSVYKAILARAIAEPQSEAVISRCIALIKQYASRYPPSAAVLEAIAVACQRLAVSVAPETGLHKSLLYLESSVARLAGAAVSSKRLAHLQSASTSSSSPRPWLQGAVNGDSSRSKAAGGSFSARSNTSADDVQPAAAAGSPTRVSCEQQRQQQQGYGAAGIGLAPVQQLQGLEEDEEAAAADELGWEQLALQDAVRVVDQQGGVPSWSFQPSALQELWCHQPDADLGELDWSLLLPHYSPSLVPLVEGLPGMEVLHMMSSQDIIGAVTDTDPQTLVRQMREVTEHRRRQAGVTPELLQQALQQSSTSRARRLFQPLPYTQQEPVELNSTDVAAVVEILCGKPSPAAPSAITGAVGLDDPSTYWQQRLRQPQQQQPLLMLYQQAGQQQQLHSESIGQISSCILVKLIVDLWLSAGGVAAFPLVLRMLQQALYQSQAEYRCLAFDIIYNLSLHGAMLMPAESSAPGSPVAQFSQGPQGGLAAGSQSCLLQQHQQQYQQQLQQLAALQRLQPAQPRYALPEGASPAAAAAAREPGSPGSASSAEHEDTDSQGSVGSHRESHRNRSNQSSPRIHLPPQFLAPQQPAMLNQQQQQPAAAAQAHNSSPVPSPKGRSRLSRSELRVTAEQHRRSSSSFRGSNGGAAVGPVGETAALGSVAIGQGTGCLGDDGQAQQSTGEHGAASSEGQLPVEVAWEVWLQQLLYELLLMLAMLEEPSEQVWQSAMGCLLHLTTHGGHWVASSLHLLPPSAAAALLDASVKFNWSHELHARLVQMAVNLLYITDPAPSAADCADAEAVAVTAGSSSGSKAQQASKVKSPGRWQQPPRQEQAVERQQHQQLRNSDHSMPGNAAAGDQSPNTSSSSHSPLGKGCQQEPDLDLPCQLHAGPVDTDQLAAFGGAAQLLKQFCYAGSVEAQRTLLVPLLQALMPDDAPDASQLAVLQALCSSPNCLAALQVTLSAGLPRWADPILSAITQLLDGQELDLQLLAVVLLRLENLAMQQQQVASPQPSGHPKVPSGPETAADDVDDTAGQQQQQQQLPDPSVDLTDGTGAALQGAIPPEVQTAMQVTLFQLAGQLPAQSQVRPGPEGTDMVVYQVQPEVQSSWKALKALCWCDDNMARRAVRLWLQQLLAVTLQQSLKNAILLPLPGVTQQPATPAGDTGSTASSRRATLNPSSDNAAVLTAVHAACVAWVEVLHQLVTHCPQGPNTLVDALQLHITSCKLQLSSDSYGTGVHAAATDTSPKKQQKQRAAVARTCVQAWALVCQWVMQARVAISQGTMTRLAGIAQSLACVPQVPDWVDVAGTSPTAAGSGAAAHATCNSTEGLPAEAGSIASAPEAAGDLASPQSVGGAAGSRQEDAAADRGAPPLEPSKEPSALAALWAAEYKGAVGGGQGVVSEVVAAAAAAEAVCWPQAFLFGRALLPQQMAQVMAGSSLALLLVRLLQCKQPSTAADRGFHGRPCSSCSCNITAGGSGSCSTATTDSGSPLCPVLYPWSDGRQDLQLGLLLMLMSSCGGDADNFTDFGLDAVTQQVLSRCLDARACLLMSLFMLEHLMRHQQQVYWSALRQLIAKAQQDNDERLLGNPYLQLVTLLEEQQKQQNEQQQKQQQPGSASASPAQVSSSSGRGGQASSGVGAGWTSVRTSTAV